MVNTVYYPYRMREITDCQRQGKATMATVKLPESEYLAAVHKSLSLLSNHLDERGRQLIDGKLFRCYQKEVICPKRLLRRLLETSQWRIFRIAVSAFFGTIKALSIKDFHKASMIIPISYRFQTVACIQNKVHRISRKHIVSLLSKNRFFSFPSNPRLNLHTEKAEES